MKLTTNLIRPLLFTPRAFDQARVYYAQFENHPDPEKRIYFADDLIEYHRFGFVKSSPTSIAFARVINVAPEESNLIEPGWFIRFALGQLPEILNMLPFNLPTITFCRNNDGVLRKYKTATLFRLARAQLKKVKNEEPK